MQISSRPLSKEPIGRDTLTARAFACQCEACGGRTIVAEVQVRITKLKVRRTETDLELLAFQDIPVSTAGLSRSAGDGCVQTTSGELAIEEGVDLGFLLTGVKFALGVVGELLRLHGLVSRSGRLGALLRYRLGVLIKENSQGVRSKEESD